MRHLHSVRGAYWFMILFIINIVIIIVVVVVVNVIVIVIVIVIVNVSIHSIIPAAHLLRSCTMRLL